MLLAGTSYDTPLFLVHDLIRVVRVLLLLAIWRTILAPDEVVGGMTASAVLTYTLIAAVFGTMLDVRTQLRYTIWSGAVVVRYLQPIGVVGIYGAEWLGQWVFDLVTFSLPLALISPLLGVDPRPASLVHGVLFVLSLGLGVTVGLAIDFLFAALLVRTRGSLWAMEMLRNSTGILLSGALLPLQLYPWDIGEVFAWLPFAAMASAPLRIYTGTGDPVSLLLSQLAWAAVLWPFAQWCWRASREQMVAAGG